MPVAAIFKLVQLLMAVGSMPLVQKFIDNMIAGTPTQVDDMVWKVLKLFLVVGGTPADGLADNLAAVQEQYERDPAAAKAPAPVVVDFDNV